MKSNLHIYIPTLSRVNKQITLKSIPQRWMERTHFVVCKEEAFAYKKEYGLDVLIAPMGTAPTRQCVIDKAHSKYVLYLDDDMIFCIRKKESTSLLRCTESEVDDMICLMETWLDEGLAHVGISARQGNNRISEDFVEIARMNNAYAYNVDLFNKAGAKFRITGMEDFDVTLTLLEKGYKNRVTYKYCWDQKGSGLEGGCSIYRDAELQAKAANALFKAHPGVVKVVGKQSRTAWKSVGAYRTDVNVQWKKAFGHPKEQGRFF